MLQLGSIWVIFVLNSEKSLNTIHRFSRVEDQKMETQQVKAYKFKVSQTNRDGTFKCPCCTAEISPDDHTEAAYVIKETKLQNNNLEEIIIQCQKCLTNIHLCGFSDIYKKPETQTKQNEAVFISHF